MRLLLRRAAGKLHKRNMAAAFQRWKEMWQEMVKMRDLMNKVGPRYAQLLVTCVRARRPSFVELSDTL
jgi:hypothetical protein